jgi:hypothetical protein
MALYGRRDLAEAVLVFSLEVLVETDQHDLIRIERRYQLLYAQDLVDDLEGLAGGLNFPSFFVII